MIIQTAYTTVIMPAYNPTNDIIEAMQQSTESAQIRVLDRVLNNLKKESDVHRIATVSEGSLSN